MIILGLALISSNKAIFFLAQALSMLYTIKSTLNANDFELTAASGNKLLITILILGLALSSSELEFHKFKEAYGKRYAKADEKLR